MRLMPEMTATNGEVVNVVLLAMPTRGRWRLIADIRRTGDDPVELRAYLRFNDTRLSETWLYQWSVE